MSAEDAGDAEKERLSWVDAHMGRTSKETAQRLLSVEQPRPPSDAPRLTLKGVRARCVAGGASNFWIVGSDAGEPVLTGTYPMIGISPTAYFIQVPEFNFLPYAVSRAQLRPDNHRIEGDLEKLEGQMRQVYGDEAKP